MGVDDLCHTGLVLGLGLPSPSSSPGDHKSKKPSEPSLTLKLSGETFDQIRPVKKVEFDCHKVGSNDHQCADLYRQDSAASSFSNHSVKRDRETGGEEIEIDRVSSRVSDEDDDGSHGRKKLRLTKAQSAHLEESFKKHSTLNPKQKQDLASELKLRPRQVEVWFQNRRARTKLKQTEADYEFLKKYCETLTDENRRLQKELKAVKLAQPLYMRLPAATLTVCPSCERISGGGGGGGGGGSSESAVTIAPSRPHFYNPFTNPSAAC